MVVSVPSGVPVETVARPVGGLDVLDDVRAAGEEQAAEEVVEGGHLRGGGIVMIVMSDDS